MMDQMELLDVNFAQELPGLFPQGTQGQLGL